MNTVALQRSRLAGILSTLSVDDMAWAVKFLKEKLTSHTHAASVDAAREKVAERERTMKFLNSVCGKWEDDKDADEMVREIYGSRENKDFGEIEKLFD